MNNLRRLTRETGAVQRAGLRLQRAPSPALAAASMEAMKKGLERVQAVELVALDPDHDGKPWVNAALVTRAAETGRQYQEVAAAYLALARSDPKADLPSFNETRLRPAYDAYLDAVEGVATATEKQSQKLNADYSAGASRFARIALGFGGWPLLVAVLILAVVSVVLLVMVLLTRRLAATDEP
jgi:hypothetical protein